MYIGEIVAAYTAKACEAVQESHSAYKKMPPAGGIFCDTMVILIVASMMRKRGA